MDRPTASVVRLVSSARHALAVSEAATDRREAFTAASLAVLRAAAALLPMPSAKIDAAPRSTWDRLVEARPDLREWAETFDRMARHARSNSAAAITDDDLRQMWLDANTFVSLVEVEVRRHRETPDAPPEASRIRAYHADSGGVLNADVLEIWPGKPGHAAYRVVPDGLLEAVVVREETWHVVVTETVGPSV